MRAIKNKSKAELKWTHPAAQELTTEQLLQAEREANRARRAKRRAMELLKKGNADESI